MFSFPARFLTYAFALGALLFAAPAAEACEPASAIARYEVAECKDHAPFSLCFAGPCKNKLGAIEAMGRFAVVKPKSDWQVDYITWSTDNLTTGATQQVSVVDPPEVCGPVPITVPGCVERYRIPNVKACAPGTQAPCPGNKVTAVLSTLEQVNQATIPGGTVILDDGQVIRGRGRRRFWLHYEVCCPDWGDFGKPGDSLSTAIDYTMRSEGIVTACVQASTRRTEPETIPDQTFPCGDD